MGRYKLYAAEFTLVAATMIIGTLGFWTIYLGSEANPQPHHHLHVLTTYAWMILLFVQLVYLARGQWEKHRRVGLAVLVAGPMMVASAAMLTAHSARRAVGSGEEDFLIVQNVVGTAWLALLVFLAFLLRKRRKVHGALLASTLVLFLGPALFFALIAFAPPFRIEGPETFYRFQTAGWTGQALVVIAVLALFFRDRRNNWPYLLAVASYFISEVIEIALSGAGLIDSLTVLVAAPEETATLVATFVLVALVLASILFPVQRTWTGNQNAPSSI